MSNKERLYNIMKKINPELNYLNESSPDVEAMERAINNNPTVSDRNSRINTSYEFKPAFEAWFETLGFDPDKITIAKIKSDIDDVLRRKGFN